MPVEKGLLLRSVAASSPAGTAGLKGLSRTGSGEVALGDIITSIDSQKIGDLDDLYRFLDKKQFGDTIQVEVFRNGKSVIVPVKLSPLQKNQQQQPTGRPAGRF